MRSLDNFLKDLSDSELATFIAYRFDDFMPMSRQKIIDEVKLRELSQEELEALFEKGPNTELSNGARCLQCNSNRFFVETDYVLKQGKYGSYEVAEETKRCRICGFNPAKSDHKSFINKIKQKLGLNKESRLKRPEIDGRMFIG